MFTYWLHLLAEPPTCCVGTLDRLRTASGQVLSADVVITNADPSFVYRNMLPASDAPPGRRRAAAWASDSAAVPGFLPELASRNPRLHI